MNKGRFAISATALISVDSYGNVKIDGVDLRSLIIKHFGFQSSELEEYRCENFVGKINFQIINIEEPLKAENTMVGDYHE